MGLSMANGLLCFADTLPAGAIADYAQRAEQAGVGTLWFPELTGRDPFAACAIALAATSTLRVGTAIANMYARDAMATKASAYTLADGYQNRFELGLGLSNPVGNTPRGHEWLPPMTKTRDFFTRYHNFEPGFPNHARVPHYLAAHGPKLMAYAAQHLDGAFSYLQPLSYTREARALLGNKQLLLMQPTVFDADRARALDTSRKVISIYTTLENYHRAWRERGFADEEFSNGGSDKFVDAIVVWGDTAQIRERFQAQQDAGVDHIIIIPVGLDLNRQAGWDKITTLV